jgi:putative flippase GtrA
VSAPRWSILNQIRRKRGYPPALHADFGGNYAVIATLARFADLRVIRYGLASVGALAVDMGSFLALLAGGLPAWAASALGYTLGIVAHWLLSSRTVFTDALAARGPARTRQKALFLASAFVGLGLTTAVVGVLDLGGTDPRLAKLAAIAVSFAATWVLRSRVVFRASPGLT